MSVDQCIQKYNEFITIEDNITATQLQPKRIRKYELDDEDYVPGKY